MKKETKRKFGEITLNLLETIAVLSEHFLDSFLDQKALSRKLKHIGFTSERLFDRLRGLQRSGYINLKSKKNLISIKLTKKGEIKLIENSKENKIDGRWRMLSFDIPEKLKNKRNALRSAIKRTGFKQVQKSLWACPYSRADEVKKIVDYYELNDYVAYFLVSKSDIDDYLEELFEL